MYKKEIMIQQIAKKLEENGMIDMHNERFEAIETVESFIYLLNYNEGMFKDIQFVEDNGIIKVKDEVVAKALMDYDNNIPDLENVVIDNYIQKLKDKDHDWMIIMQYLLHYHMSTNNLVSLVRLVDRKLNLHVLIFSDHSVKDVAETLIREGILRKFVNDELYNY